ncbi:MAG: hypothetical protein Q9204_006019 [Flavoplaca sp. TL-2023a]
MSSQPSSSDPTKSDAIIDPEGRIELFRKGLVGAKVLSKLTDVTWPPFLELPVTDPLKFLDEIIKWMEKFRSRPSDGDSDLQYTQAIVGVHLGLAELEREKLERRSAEDKTKKETGN